MRELEAHPMQANIIEPARDMDLRLRTINSIHNRIPIRRFTPSWGPALSNEYTEPLSGLALLPMGIFHGADLYDGALLAAIAVIGIIGRYPLAHNAEIIQTWLNTVVWAAADADFELVGKFDIIPALVECFVQFTR